MSINYRLDGPHDGLTTRAAAIAAVEDAKVGCCAPLIPTTHTYTHHHHHTHSMHFLTRPVPSLTSPTTQLKNKNIDVEHP